METTLNKIKQHIPCELGWEKLLKFLNKTEADNEPLVIKTILESNGVAHAIWALRAVDGKDKEIRLMAADFAESVLNIYEEKYPNDDRPCKAIQAARDYANGLINVDELHKAKAAAKAAASGAGCDVAAWAAAMAASNVPWAASYAAELKKQEEILLKYL